jgi:hypothetical protein
LQEIFPNNPVVGLPEVSQIIAYSKENYLKATMQTLREIFPSRDILPYIENDFEILLSHEDEDLH